MVTQRKALLYRIIHPAQREKTHGLPVQPDTPMKVPTIHPIIHTILLLAMVVTTTLLQTLKTTTHTATLRGTTPTTVRTTILLWIAKTTIHTTTILLTVPTVLLCIPLAMAADTPTASQVIRGFVIPTTGITVHPAAVSITKTTRTIPLIGPKTITPARVVDISGTKAANWNKGVVSRAVTCLAAAACDLGTCTLRPW